MVIRRGALALKIKSLERVFGMGEGMKLK